MSQSVKLLKPEEVAERLSLGRTTVYRLIASGELASVQIGRARRISEHAVEQFVRALEGDGR